MGVEILKLQPGAQALGAAPVGLVSSGPGGDVGRAVMCGDRPGEQAGHARGCSVWTGGSGIWCVCCFSFLTKRLVLASLSHSWDLVEDTRSGLGRAMEVQILHACRPRALCPSLPGSLRGPELMRRVGNQVRKLKNKGMRLRPSRVPEILTGEGEGRRGQPVEGCPS